MRLFLAGPRWLGLVFGSAIDLGRNGCPGRLGSGLTLGFGFGGSAWGRGGLSSQGSPGSRALRLLGLWLRQTAGGRGTLAGCWLLRFFTCRFGGRLGGCRFGFGSGFGGSRTIGALILPHGAEQPAEGALDFADLVEGRLRVGRELQESLGQILSGELKGFGQGLRKISGESGCRK